MSKETQIEEMAKDICLEKQDCNDVCNPDKSCTVLKYVQKAYEQGYRKMPDNIGDFSDGCHTFNELYHHRAVLFSVICNMFPDKAWKSKLHDTGDMFEGMFIVGIETEHGQATYHCDIDPYWDMFKVKELEKAPKWDGHTPSDAIERIGNLPCADYRKQEWISVDERLPEIEGTYLAYTLRRTIEIAHFYTYYVNGKPQFDYWITHWMPLPEAPRKEDEGK